MGGWDPETTTNRLSISNIARIRRQSTGASDHNWLPGPIHKRKGLAPRMGSKTHSNNGAPASVTLVVTIQEPEIGVEYRMQEPLRRGTHTYTSGERSPKP